MQRMCIMGNSIGDQVGGQADVGGWEGGKRGKNQGKHCQASKRRSAVWTCVAASTLAPLSSSSRTTSTWPFCAAMHRPEMPSCAGRAGAWGQGGQDAQRRVPSRGTCGRCKGAS